MTVRARDRSNAPIRHNKHQARRLYDRAERAVLCEAVEDDFPRTLLTLAEEEIDRNRTNNAGLLAETAKLANTSCQLIGQIQARIDQGQPSPTLSLEKFGLLQCRLQEAKDLLEQRQHHQMLRLLRELEAEAWKLRALFDLAYHLDALGDSQHEGEQLDQLHDVLNGEVKRPRPEKAVIMARLYRARRRRHALVEFRQLDERLDSRAQNEIQQIYFHMREGRLPPIDWQGVLAMVETLNETKSRRWAARKLLKLVNEDMRRAQDERRKLVEETSCA